MIIEVIHSRGLAIHIDGERPKTGWCLGDNENGDAYTCKEHLGSDRGVAIGPHRVTGLSYDCLMEAFDEGTDPKLLTLQTEAGPITATVVQICNISNEEPPTLEGGLTRNWNDTDTYVKAIA